MKNILVIAPHCDDEILGCGGMIARSKKEGHKVHIAIVTNGHLGAPELFPEEGTKRVRAEALAAHELLSVDSTHFLDFPAPRLDNIPSYKLSIAIGKLIKELGITDMYLPHRGDIHKDHTITFEAGLVAARPINNCPVKRVYTYETLSETEWAPTFGDDQFIPNVFYIIADELELKLQAFKCFKTQIKEFPHPRSLDGITHLARYRGSTVECKAAEAFCLIRSID